MRLSADPCPIRPRGLLIGGPVIMNRVPCGVNTDEASIFGLKRKSQIDIILLELYVIRFSGLRGLFLGGKHLGLPCHPCTAIAYSLELLQPTRTC